MPQIKIVFAAIFFGAAYGYLLFCVLKKLPAVLQHEALSGALQERKNYRR